MSVFCFTNLIDVWYLIALVRLFLEVFRLEIVFCGARNIFVNFGVKLPIIMDTLVITNDTIKVDMKYLYFFHNFIIQYFFFSKMLNISPRNYWSFIG